jgi:transposase-like protein
MAAKTVQLKRLSEEEARTLIENARWPDGPVCVKCGSVNASKLGGKAGALGQHKCKDCRAKFTVRVGTIFEDSPIPLRDWVYAFASMCSSKKGISAHQLHRELGVTYKTAWFMCHRIRLAMREDGTLKLEGTVESDEAWIGGKPRKKNNFGHMSKQGQSDKQPVQTLVERDGRKYTRVIPTVSAGNLRKNIDALVDKSGTLMTDQSIHYRTVGYEFAGGHQSVDHGTYEYCRKADNAHINTAESAHALLKRGVYGTFHHVSKEHLQRYCDEFDFRWNNRKVTDLERTFTAIKQADGKRLMYRQPLV